MPEREGLDCWEESEARSRSPLAWPQGDRPPLRGEPRVADLVRGDLPKMVGDLPVGDVGVGAPRVRTAVAAVAARERIPLVRCGDRVRW